MVPATVSIFPHPHCPNLSCLSDGRPYGDLVSHAKGLGSCKKEKMCVIRCASSIENIFNHILDIWFIKKCFGIGVKHNSHYSFRATVFGHCSVKLGFLFLLIKLVDVSTGLLFSLLLEGFIQPIAGVRQKGLRSIWIIKRHCFRPQNRKIEGRKSVRNHFLWNRLLKTVSQRGRRELGD